MPAHAVGAAGRRCGAIGAERLKFPRVALGAEDFNLRPLGAPPLADCLGLDGAVIAAADLPDCRDPLSLGSLACTDGFDVGFVFVHC